MIKTPEAIVLMLLSAFVSFFYSSPYIFPVMLLLGGLSTSIKYKNQPKVEEDKSLQIKWNNFYLWGGVLILAAVAGAITKSQPILLFENFYRNGSLIFGGGQVLIPYLYAEFVDLKQFSSFLHCIPAQPSLFWPLYHSIVFNKRSQLLIAL